MYYAEFGTDKHIIDAYFPNKTDGIMIEAGAAHPNDISMSKAFRELGWRTICVEPNPFFVDLHKNAGNEIYQYALSDKIEKNHDFEVYRHSNEPLSELSLSAIKVRYSGYENCKKTIIKVDIVTLNWLLESLAIEHIDFLSLDVEGWEIDAMKGFDHAKYSPEIILLENINHDQAYNTYMNSIGYKLVHAINFNFIYKKSTGDRGRTPIIISKPWGQEEILENNEHYTVKRLIMNTGCKCSLQYHEHKTETIYVISGNLYLHVDDNIIVMHPHDSVTIFPGCVHRMEAREAAVAYLECSTSQLDDVIRLQDDYNRT